MNKEEKIYEVRNARNGDLCIMSKKYNTRIATFSKGARIDAQTISELLQSTQSGAVEMYEALNKIVKLWDDPKNPSGVWDHVIYAIAKEAINNIQQPQSDAVEKLHCDFLKYLEKNGIRFHHWDSGMPVYADEKSLHTPKQIYDKFKNREQ